MDSKLYKQLFTKMVRQIEKHFIQSVKVKDKTENETEPETETETETV